MRAPQGRSFPSWQHPADWLRPVLNERALRSDTSLRAVQNFGLLILLCGVCILVVFVRVGAARRPVRSESSSSSAGGPLPSVKGIATYYADDFDGQVMADGTVFDKTDPTVTAANRWPLGTKLRIRRIPGSPWDATLTPDERQEFFSRTVTVT